jgi:hypothetical protein
MVACQTLLPVTRINALALLFTVESQMSRHRADANACFAKRLGGEFSHAFALAIGKSVLSMIWVSKTQVTIRLEGKL